MFTGGADGGVGAPKVYYCYGCHDAVVGDPNIHVLDPMVAADNEEDDRDRLRDLLGVVAQSAFANNNPPTMNPADMYIDPMDIDPDLR